MVLEKHLLLVKGGYHWLADPLDALQAIRDTVAETVACSARRKVLYDAVARQRMTASQGLAFYSLRSSIATDPRFAQVRVLIGTATAHADQSAAYL